MFVKSSADDARSAGKALIFQMVKQGVDGFRPWAGLAVDDLADADDFGAATAG